MCEVTIVIPVYNTEQYLKKAIESCLNQTFKDLEIIVINDGLTDNSLQIAREYEARFNCVKVISTENRGLSEARNKGLDEAKGRYIYFLDSDDWIEPQTIEQCYLAAVGYDLDMVLFDSRVEVDGLPDLLNEVNYEGYIRKHVVSPYNVYTGRQFIELYGDRRGVFVQAWLVFIKRDFLLKNNIRFLPGAYYEDVAFHFSCMMTAERIMYLPYAFHVRLYREGSIMTSSLNIRKICSVYEITKELYSEILHRGRQNDCLWISYLIRLIKNLYRVVLTKVSRKDIEALKPYDKEILGHQRDVILIYCKLLTLMGDKVSNVRKALEFIDEVITPLGWISEDMTDAAGEIVSEREKLICKIFCRLPFNEESKLVGIYGSGRHAEFILNKYKELIGDIKANLVFIDTYKESFSDKFFGYDIINIDDIHTLDISEIVILSYFYEEEMHNNIVARYGDRYKIHRIYNCDSEPLDSTYYLNLYNRLKKLKENGRKKIILINTPLHTNVGDHMIAYAAKKFFDEFLPDYEVSEVTNKSV